MGDYIFTICYKWEDDSEIEKELYAAALYPARVIDERYGIDEFEVMFKKGLRYIPTIFLTAFKIRWLMRSNVRVVYNKLKRKVKVEVKDRCHDTDNYTARRAFWPCEVLDLKEVQDEVGVLTGGALLSRDKPEDRKIVEQAIKWLGEDERKMPIEEVVDRNIGFLNACIQGIGFFLTRSTEFHRKHPDARFWFYVEFD